MGPIRSSSTQHTTGVPHIFAYEPHSQISHPDSLGTLPQSFSIFGACCTEMAPISALIALQGKGGHEAVSFCLFTSNSCIKDILTGKLEDKSAQLKGSHQNYTNLDLLFLHRPTRQCTVGLSGKDTPIVHCPMHVGIYIYLFASSSCLADSSSHLFS